MMLMLAMKTYEAGGGTSRQRFELKNKNGAADGGRRLKLVEDHEEAAASVHVEGRLFPLSFPATFVWKNVKVSS
ncbi:uncharacterized protein V6R79_023244 [Siganus canaliculatus]